MADKVHRLSLAASSRVSSSDLDRDSESFEIVKDLVAAQLRKEGIQLWLPPYTVEETGEVGQFPLVC